MFFDFDPIGVAKGLDALIARHKGQDLREDFRYEIEYDARYLLR
jgi:hypothetical protein